MPPPILKRNTFVGDTAKVIVDPISKFFIITESFLGLNRRRIFGNTRYINRFLAIKFSLIINCLMIYLITVNYRSELVRYLGINAFGYIFSTVYSFFSWKHLKSFYEELNKFDMETGGGPTVVPGSIRNLIHMSVSIISIIVIFIMSSTIYRLLVNIDNILLNIILLLVRFVYTLEYHYYGHLINLLICKIRHINSRVEASLPESNIDRIVEEDKPTVNNIKNMRMNKIMDLYNYVITAYDFLVTAMKWQLLLTIVTSFLLILWVCYDVSLNLINEYTPWSSVTLDIITTTVKILPMFAPCISGDQLHSEVLRLRELIASKLFENKLDKVSRSSARTLLALTENRDLSFALLRMWNIDISFPFNFIGLLITYLIILLQFEKVLNPDRS